MILYLILLVSIVSTCAVYILNRKCLTKKNYIIKNLNDINKYRFFHVVRMTAIVFILFLFFSIVFNVLAYVFFEYSHRIKEVVILTLVLTVTIFLVFYFFMPVSLVLKESSNITFEIKFTSKVISFHLKDPYNISRAVVENTPIEVKEIMLFINNSYYKYLLSSPVFCNKNGSIRKYFVVQFKKKVEEAKCINYKEVKVKVSMLTKASLFLAKGGKVKMNSPYAVKIYWETQR